jgi:tryptophanyl-tRNA synthetase
MGADILMFNAHRVPVGRDQVQHIEMARDMGQRFNHLFGQGRELFVLPEAVIDEVLAMLPGLDGRKMSKSYDNIIPLFEGGAKALKEAVARIVTDSRLPGEPKDADSAHLVTIYDAFATPAERAAFRAELKAGLGWGDAKQKVIEQLEREIAPMRERYDALMAHPERIEEILMEGAGKARAIASPLLATLREAVGLRRFRPTGGKVGTGVALEGQSIATATGKMKVKPPEFKQYREGGEFFFKLVAADGRLLLQSHAFATGKEAGQSVAALRGDGVAALARAGAALGDGVTEQDVAEALAALAAA